MTMLVIYSHNLSSFLDFLKRFLHRTSLFPPLALKRPMAHVISVALKPNHSPLPSDVRFFYTKYIYIIFWEELENN